MNVPKRQRERQTQMRWHWRTTRYGCSQRQYLHLLEVCSMSTIYTHRASVHILMCILLCCICGDNLRADKLFGRCRCRAMRGRGNRNIANISQIASRNRAPRIRSRPFQWRKYIRYDIKLPLSSSDAIQLRRKFAIPKSTKN